MEPGAEKIFDVGTLKNELNDILRALDSIALEESNPARGKFLQLKEEINLKWSKEEMPSDILELYEKAEGKIEAMEEDDKINQKEARGEATA